MVKDYLWAVLFCLGTFTYIFIMINKRIINKHIKYSLVSKSSKVDNIHVRKKIVRINNISSLIKRKIIKKLPINEKNNLKNIISMSGTKMSLENIALLKISLSLIMFFIILLLIPKVASPVLRILLVIIGTITPYKWPDFFLKRKAKIRQKKIRKVFPDFVDYLIICVQAGMGIDLSIYKIIEKVEGPLSEEIKKALIEINLGRPKNEVYKDLSDRIGLPEIRNFFTALVSGEQMGISVSQILQVQADQMRQHKKQRMQEEANKIPTKLVFPLVLFLLPELFIVVLGPALIQIFNKLIT